MSLPNIRLHYLYRDASNYKSHRHVVFANPNLVPPEVVWNALKTAVEDVTLLPDMPYFRPEWVDLPTTFLFDDPATSRNCDDHDWHELGGVEATELPCTFSSDMTIDLFIRRVARTHKKSSHRNTNSY